MSKTRHGSIPLHKTATGVGFDLRGQLKSIGAQFGDLQRHTAQYKKSIRDVCSAALAQAKEQSMPDALKTMAAALEGIRDLN